jgi:hypothetical protein
LVWRGKAAGLVVRDLGGDACGRPGSRRRHASIPVRVLDFVLADAFLFTGGEHRTVVEPEPIITANPHDQRARVARTRS